VSVLPLGLPPWEKNQSFTRAAAGRLQRKSPSSPWQAATSLAEVPAGFEFGAEVIELLGLESARNSASWLPSDCDRTRPPCAAAETCRPVRWYVGYRPSGAFVDHVAEIEEDGFATGPGLAVSGEASGLEEGLHAFDIAMDVADGIDGGGAVDLANGGVGVPVAEEFAGLREEEFRERMVQGSGGPRR
jgi:hypothetical protein